MKFTQIAVLNSSERLPPQIVALSEDGEIYVYTPSTYLTNTSREGVRERVSINQGGWDKLPDPK